MYRFNLNGTHVECDSPSDLLAILGRADEIVKPTTVKQRARKQVKPANLGATQSWRAAEAYAKRNGKMTVNEARSFLALHPDVKQKVLAELAGK